MDQRFTLRPMDDEGRTMSLVAPPTMMVNPAGTVVDIDITPDNYASWGASAQPDATSARVRQQLCTARLLRADTTRGTSFIGHLKGVIAAPVAPHVVARFEVADSTTTDRDIEVVRAMIVADLSRAFAEEPTS